MVCQKKGTCICTVWFFKALMMILEWCMCFAFFSFINKALLHLKLPLKWRKLQPLSPCLYQDQLFAPSPYHHIEQLHAYKLQRPTSIQNNLSTQNQKLSYVTKEGSSKRWKWRERGLPLWWWSCAWSSWASMSTQPLQHSAAAAYPTRRKHVVHFVFLRVVPMQSARTLAVSLVFWPILVNSLNSLYSMHSLYVHTGFVVSWTYTYVWPSWISINVIFLLHFPSLDFSHITYNEKTCYTLFPLQN